MKDSKKIKSGPEIQEECETQDEDGNQKRDLVAEYVANVEKFAQMEPLKLVVRGELGFGQVTKDAMTKARLPAAGPVGQWSVQVHRFYNTVGQAEQAADYLIALPAMCEALVEEVKRLRHLDARILWAQSVEEDNANLVTIHARQQDCILQLEGRLREWEEVMAAQDRYVDLRSRMEGKQPLVLGSKGAELRVSGGSAPYEDTVPARDYTYGGRMMPNADPTGMSTEMLVNCPCGEGFCSPTIPCEACGQPEGGGVKIAHLTDEDRLEEAQKEVVRRKTELDLHKLSPYKKGNTECD